MFTFAGFAEKHTFYALASFSLSANLAGKSNCFRLIKTSFLRPMRTLILLSLASTYLGVNCQPPTSPQLSHTPSPNFPNNIVYTLFLSISLRIYRTGIRSGFKFRMFLIPASLISDAPVFVAAPADRVGDAGERIEMECRVDSNPPPTYSWIRNDLPSVVSF